MTPLSERVPWSRRHALQGLSALLLAGGCRGRSPRGSPVPRFEGFPIQHLASFLTPTADFFVRDHFGIPPEALQTPSPWKIWVEGAVENPMSLGLDELAKLGRLEMPVTLECAGNAGRNGAGWPGAQRAWSGASTATFQGYSLASLVAFARPHSSTKEVVFVGADEGAEPGSTDRNPFARSVSLDAARSTVGMLADGMNGSPLPPLHGGPLRVILPGRYATDSVKWVQRIRFVSEPFNGFYVAKRYRKATPANPRGEPLGEMLVQSEIAHPKPGDRLPRGMMVDIEGVAWGGTGGPARVELSTDGGEHFAEATFVDPERSYCWRRWRWRWHPEQAGPRWVVARATDRAGATQPLESDEESGVAFSVSGPDRIQYGNNAVPVVPVVVV